MQRSHGEVISGHTAVCVGMREAGQREENNRIPIHHNSFKLNNVKTLND